MSPPVSGMRGLSVVLLALAAALYGAVLAGIGSHAATHPALDRLAARDACLVTLDARPPRRGC